MQRHLRTQPPEEFSAYPVYLVLAAITCLWAYLILATDFLESPPSAKVYLLELDAERKGKPMPEVPR